MSTTNVITRSGNRVAVEFDGQEVGLVQSVRSTDNYGLEKASGIGDIHAHEYVPTVADHTLSVSSMTLIRGNLLQLGLIPENGDAVLKGTVFDIVEYDKDSNLPIRSWVSCSFDSGDTSVDAHRIVMLNASFKCLDVRGTG